MSSLLQPGCMFSCDQQTYLRKIGILFKKKKKSRRRGHNLPLPPLTSERPANAPPSSAFPLKGTHSDGIRAWKCSLAPKGRPCTGEGFERMIYWGTRTPSLTPSASTFSIIKRRKD